MMYKVRSIIAAAASAGLLASLVPQTFASFTDVQSSTHYKTAIESLQQRGVIEGYADGSFGVDATINRAEFLKIVLEARGTEIGEADDCFPDVSAEDWFSAYVCSAKDEDIVEGYPTGEFDPEKPVNFVEAAKILSLAYGLNPKGGSEWYEPFAMALDSSKAIPPTIAKLDASLTRGEMAEIMWRLSEGETDEDAIGYLNVKYPDVAVNFASDDVQQAETCLDIEVMAEEAQSSGGSRGGMMYKMAEGDMAAPTAAANESTAQSGGSDDSYSQTNIQVAGVDEADTTKTDGTFLYTISGNDVHVVRAVPASSMEKTDTLTFSESEQPQGLYVADGKLTVVTSDWKSSPYPYPTPMMEKMIAPDSYPYYGGTAQTNVYVYDVENDGTLTKVRNVSFDGSQISSRMIDDRMYLVMNQGMSWPGPIMPMYRDSADGSAEKEVAKCGDVMILPRVPSPQYLIIATIDTGDDDSEVKREVIVGDGQNVYSSKDNLYVATTEWNYVWDAYNPQSGQKTRVYKFDINANGVTFDEKGTVDGRILNQFSMDEHESTFRIATQEDAQWDSMGKETTKSSTAVHILNDAMIEVGTLDGIAPGEQMYSARFIGDRVYLVTFKIVDPLFVIDTSDARNPKILGKLKIPGYSQYLHPYDENHLIGFGKEVDESIDADKVHSDDAVYYTAVLGVKVSIFDVSDVEHPKETYKTVIGTGGSESPILYDHKALLFDKSRNLLAFPVTAQILPEAGSISNTVYQGAYVYDISLDKGFTLRGRISHYPKQDVWWPDGTKDISRIVRIGDSLYTISGDEIQAHTEDDVKFEGQLELTE